MKRPFQLNRTLRGFLLIAVASALIVLLRLQASLVVVSALLQVLFILAIGFFVYFIWRDNRHEISLWPARVRAAFYGAAALIVVDIAAYWYERPSGPNALAFFLVLGFSGFSMWRVWRDQRHYA